MLVRSLIAQDDRGSRVEDRGSKKKIEDQDELSTLDLRFSTFDCLFAPCLEHVIERVSRRVTGVHQAALAGHGAAESEGEVARDLGDVRDQLAGLIHILRPLCEVPFRAANIPLGEDYRLALIGGLG